MNSTVPTTRFASVLGCARLWALVALICLLACGAQQNGSDSKQSRSKEKSSGQPIEMTLSQLDGEQFDLKSLRGRFVIVSYFGSWHERGLDELRRLNGMAKSGDASADLAVVAIALDVKPRHSIPKLMTAIEPSFPILLADKEALHGRTPFGELPGVPTSYLLDRQGLVTDTLFGAIPQDYIRRRIRELSKDDP